MKKLLMKHLPSKKDLSPKVEVTRIKIEPSLIKMKSSLHQMSLGADKMLHRGLEVSRSLLHQLSAQIHKANSPFKNRDLQYKSSSKVCLVTEQDFNKC